MRELVTMWRDARMIVLVAVVAAIYAAVLLPFKLFAVVPEFTSVRPAAVFPVVFSLLFGPAAAWGSAIGNLGGDALGGTFGPGSAFGFVGNFFFGVVGYRLWGNLGPLTSGEEPNFRENAGMQLIEYLVVAVTASLGCAAIIAWGIDLLGLLPFPVLGSTIPVNNLLAAAVLGPPLLYLTYPRIKEMGLLYPDVLRDSDTSHADPSRARLAAWGLAVVSVVWLGLGLYVVPPQSIAQMALGAVGLAAIVVLLLVSGERLSELVG